MNYVQSTLETYRYIRPQTDTPKGTPTPRIVHSQTRILYTESKLMNMLIQIHAATKTHSHDTLPWFLHCN